MLPSSQAGAILNRREFNILISAKLLGLSSKDSEASASSTVLDLTLNEQSLLWGIAPGLSIKPGKPIHVENTVFNINSKWFGYIDFNKASHTPRLEFMSSQSGELQYSSLVSHGVNSGGITPHLFSNIPNSYQSSLGIYLVGHRYYGRFGESYKLYGLSPTNSRVFSRYIVFHSAQYASLEHYYKYGFLGRSLGCLAVPPSTLNQLRPLLIPGALIFTKAIDPENTLLDHEIPRITLEEKTENGL